jgi:serine/threonine-protein kinase RsbW
VTEDSGIRPARSRDFGRSPDSGQHAAIPPRFLRSFAGRPDQVAAARRFVAAALADCPAVADVVLLTSELTTNAIQHSATGRGGSFTVAISHGPGRVRVTVTDGGSATRPMVGGAGGAAAELSTTGRGLILVDFLTVRWGYADPRDTDSPGPAGAGTDGAETAGAGPAGAGAPAAGWASAAVWESGTVWFELDCS